MTKKDSVSEILLQHFRKKKKSSPGFSMAVLARLMKVSQPYISQIMNGARSLPPEKIDAFCEFLDIDEEKKELLSIAVLEKQGWSKTPKKSLRGAEISAQAHAGNWESAAIKDFTLLEDWHTVAILETTNLKGYDGSLDFLNQRLGFGRPLIDATLRRLQDAGFLEQKNGRWIKRAALLEVQSRRDKKSIQNYHKTVMKKAQAIMDETSTEEDLSLRLITSGIFTVSRDQIPYLRAKLAEILKEIVIESDSHQADEVYQLGIQFFPVTRVQKKSSV